MSLPETPADVVESPAPETQQAPSLPTGWFGRLLFDTSRGMRRYIIRAWLLSLIPSLAIGIAIAALGGLNGQEPIGTKLGNPGPGELLFLLLVFAPVVETFLLAGILWLLRRLVTRRVYPLAALSALVWAVLHIPNGVVIPFVIAWPFFVFSCAYIAWRPRAWWRAIFVTATVHLLQNLLPGFANAFL